MATDDANDAELQDLLDSALEDFDKLSIPPPSVEPSVPIASPGTASSTKYRPAPPPPEGAEQNLDAEAARLADLFASSLGPGSVLCGSQSEDPTISQEELAKMMEAMEASLGALLEERPDDDEDIRKVKEEARKLAEAEQKLTSQEESNTNPSGDASPEDPAAQMARCLQNLTSALPDWSTGESETEDADSGPLEGLLQSMLRQLLDREVVYPPLKAVVERYPDWLRDHGEGLSEADVALKRKQAMLLGKVCDRYEAIDSRQPSDTELKEIMTLIEEAMRDGPPPQDLVDAVSSESGGTVDEEKLTTLLRDRNIDPSACVLM